MQKICHVRDKIENEEKKKGEEKKGEEEEEEKEGKEKYTLLLKTLISRKKNLNRREIFVKESTIICFKHRYLYLRLNC